MNRWQALVEVVRLLVESGRPSLAFASVCVFILPLTVVTSLFFLLSNEVAGSFPFQLLPLVP